MKRTISLLLCLMTLISVAAPAAYAMEIPGGISSDDIYFGDGANVTYNPDGSITIGSAEEDQSYEEDPCPEEQLADPEPPREVGQASVTVEDTTVDALGVPEDSSLKIQEAKPEVEAIIDEMAAAREDTGEQLFRYDISVEDAAGMEWQPNGKVRMELTVPSGQKLHKHQPVYVVHVSDDGQADYIDAYVTDAGTIVFDTDSFSAFAVFTVDFEFDGVPFSINGLDDILLSKLLDELEMPIFIEDVAEVTFSDYSLISVEKQGDDWLLTSLQPFTTTESLKVTLEDGKVYDITVKDAATYTHPVIKYNGKTYVETDNSFVWYTDGDGDLSNLTTSNNNDRKIYNYDKSVHYNTITIDASDSTNKVMKIALRPAYYATSFKFNIKQFKITGGAQVTIYVSPDFDKPASHYPECSTVATECILRAVDTSHMFLVEDGSLTLQGRDNTKLVIDGSSKGTNVESEKLYPDYPLTSTNPLVRLHKGASSLTMSNVTLRDGEYGGVFCEGDTVDSITMTSVTFENTVNRSTKVLDGKGGNGGAIYICQETNEANSNGNYPFVDVKNMTLTDVHFLGNDAQDGGAMAILGKVWALTIDGCEFKNNHATHPDTADVGSNGGALFLGGTIGRAVIKNSSFSGCTAMNGGGAIYVETRWMSAAGDKKQYSCINELTIKDNTFTSCSTSGGMGGGISVEAQIDLLQLVRNSFSKCKADNGDVLNRTSSGGAIALGKADLPADWGENATYYWSNG
ncbi:MAG: hypothetical protein IJW45_00160, partial [Oscillospiraceae bacterium]|nr:hypothetical protein [Oscillospiraceae bacterium]